jgi:phosphatidylserine/phosphatidylglycerophosphate/cardiolipin synthase-like enzyme
MSGERHKIDSTGAMYQDFAKVILGPIAALVEVPRQHDYGIDFFCQLLKPIGPVSQTVTDLFAIQVKGGKRQLRYGGVKKGKWAEHAISHNKVMMIDGEIVIMGSFNFTKAAQEKNAENVLIIRDPALATQYTQNWKAHAQHSQPYLGRGVQR